MTFKAPVLREIVDPEAMRPVPNMEVEVGCMDVGGWVALPGTRGWRA